MTLHNEYTKFAACSCGRTHTLPDFQTVLGNQGLEAVPQYLKTHAVQRPLLVADPNTWAVLGEEVHRLLDDMGIAHDALVFEDTEPAADEDHLGQLMQGCLHRPDCLVSVASGTITDLVRYAAYLMTVPHVAVATAPSMDGYASSVAPLISKGHKITYLAKAPELIVGIPAILAAAPKKMIAAGFGDLMGKITAKADWLLSHYLHGEAHCAEIQALVDAAVADTIKLLEQTEDNDAEADQELLVTKIMEGLIHSGAAITLMGFSRPASGAEHHFSHYWEMQALRDGHTPELHGLKVGYATWIVLQIYEWIRQRRSEGQLSAPEAAAFDQATGFLPAAAAYAEMAHKAHVVLNPEGLGMDERQVRQAVREALYVRDRYTVLRLAESHNWLDALADEVNVRWLPEQTCTA